MNGLNTKVSKVHLAERLRKMSLFAGVNDTTLSKLVQASFQKKVEKGGYLFYRGDPADNFYLLLSGEINLTLSSSDGREIIINEMHPGDFFGELGLLTGQPRSANAVARLAADLLAIPRQDFLSAIEREPCLAKRLLETTAVRLSRTSEFQDALAFLDAQTRLARILLELGDQCEDLDEIIISQEELAQRAGLIRQTVAKTLSLWRRNGWLSTGRGRIHILNFDAMRLWLVERAGCLDK